jgi:hypothetical protein
MTTEPAHQPSASRVADDDAPLLEQFLSTHDVPCPGCGYNLRHLTSARCPECAQEIKLGVHLAEPRQGWLIAGLIGLSAGAGLSGLLIVYGLIANMTTGISGLGRFFFANGVGFFLFATALFLWLHRWRRLRRLSTLARAALVLGIWISVFTFLVLFTIYIA